MGYKVWQKVYITELSEEQDIFEPSKMWPHRQKQTKNKRNTKTIPMPVILGVNVSDKEWPPKVTSNL